MTATKCLSTFLTAWLCLLISLANTSLLTPVDQAYNERDGPLIEPSEPESSNFQIPTLSLREDTEAADSWHNISIVFDTSAINDPSDSETKKILELIVFRQVKARLEPAIKVPGSGTITLPTQLSCFETIVPPPEFASNGRGDLFIAVTIRDDQDKNYLASGGPCFFDLATGRPTAGLLIINRRYFASSYDSMVFWTDNLVHEILHVLIYSRSIWEKVRVNAPDFFSQVGDGQGNQVNLLKGAGLVDFGRGHFNCSDYSGLIMEEGGGAGSSGSHLEKLLYGNELLTAKFTPVSVLSPFSLLLMQDSGFYRTDLGFAEPLMWGFQRGCEFLRPGGSSPTSPEFCTTNGAVACSHDFISKAVCSSDKYTNGRLINEFYAFNSCRDNYGFVAKYKAESNGAGSRCFLLSDKDGVQAAGCFKASCSADASEVAVEIAGVVFDCKAKGQKLAFEDLKIVCPDPKDFCLRALMNKCPNDCSGRGKCLQNGTCACYFLYRGEACQYFEDCKGVESCDKLKVNSLGIKVTSSAVWFATFLALAFFLLLI